MLITDVDVLSAEGKLQIGVNVAVKDGRFCCIGKQIPDGDWGERINGSGLIMIPGLVNAHTHVPMTLMRGYGDDMPLDKWLFERIFPVEDKLTGDHVYWGSMLGIAEMIACGITSFSDMYYYCSNISKAVLESGIKANIGRGISCFDNTKRFADLPAHSELVELIDKYHKSGDGRILIDAAPHSEYTTRPDILFDVAEFAKMHKLRVQVHLSETRKEHLECTGRHGKTPARVLRDSGIFDLPVTAAHCVWLTDLDIEMMCEYDVTVAHCPQSNLKLASGIAQVEKMRQAGMKIALGTDSAASNNNLDMFEEMRTAALLAKGVSLDPCALPACKVLYMATRAGALAQGRHDSGDIKQGYLADFVLLDKHRPEMVPCHDVLSNVVYSAGAASVKMTVVNGRTLYRDGNYLTIDIDRVVFETKRCVSLLI